MSELSVLDTRPAPLQGTNHARSILVEAERSAPGDVLGQMAYFLQNFRIPSARGRARPVSFTTTRRYQESFSAALSTLRAQNIRLTTIRQMTHKHVRICIREWEAQGLSSSTLTNRFTVLRRLMEWTGRENLPCLREMLNDPSRATRTFVADKPLDWESAGVDFQALLIEVAKTCRYTAMQLRLERAFGLRSQESLSLKPAESDKDTLLLVTRGTKGGKARAVPIRTQEQREVLDAAKAMANRRTGLLQRYGLSGEQARKHYYYVLSKHSITRKGLGVTPHGLRHAYAHDRYFDVTGEAAPVLAGKRPTSPDDAKARLQVSAELGHVRKEITGAYVGAIRQQPASQRRRLHDLADRLAQPQLTASLKFMADELRAVGYETRLYVLGADAQGMPVPAVQPLAVGVEIQPLPERPNGAIPVGDALMRVQMFSQGPLFMAVNRSTVYLLLQPGGRDGERLEILF